MLQQEKSLQSHGACDPYSRLHCEKTHCTEFFWGREYETCNVFNKNRLAKEQARLLSEGS